MAGLKGTYTDRSAPEYQALDGAERHAVWDGERAAKAAASYARAVDEARAAETARVRRREADAARALDIARFLADNPGIDITSLKPRVFPGYTYLPGQECESCDGEDDDGRCLMSDECLFRYRAGVFTRQAGICPWCSEPLPGHLGMAKDHRGVKLADVAIDHIIPESRGGPDREWNKQLLHLACNSAKASRLTDAAYTLAADHGVLLLDFLTVYGQLAPVPSGTPTHLLPPLRWVVGTGRFHLSVEHGGWRYRTLCGRQLGLEWAAVHGDDGHPQNVTCHRCAQRREQLGLGNTRACRCVSCAPPSPG